MSTPFEEMTNAELKEACEDFGLEVEAKNPAKPNKAEYLTALSEFKASQDTLHADKVEAKAAEPVTDGSKRKPQTTTQLIRLDMFNKIRCIVHDQQESQTKDELISVSWGNRTTGGQTDFVDVASGEPQYIRRGAIINLQNATMAQHTSKDNGGVDIGRKKRFIVVEVDGMSEAELKDLANKQKLRTAKYA